MNKRSSRPFRPFFPLKVGGGGGANSVSRPLPILLLVVLVAALAPLIGAVDTPQPVRAQGAETETALPSHYDTDGNGLIEISSLAQLNAVRWDLDGTGVADDADNNDAYAAAFPVAEDGSVCPAETTCAGYELTANLDFDENGDGEITEADAAYWNDGAGWLPIGTLGIIPYHDGEVRPDRAPLFDVTVDGNGHTIANLYVDRPSSHTVGLFSVLGRGAEVRNLGLPGVGVTGNRYAGGLAGYSEIETSIIAAWATGEVVGHDVGGLIGETFGSANPLLGGG